MPDSEYTLYHRRNIFASSSRWTSFINSLFVQRIGNSILAYTGLSTYSKKICTKDSSLYVHFDTVLFPVLGPVEMHETAVPKQTGIASAYSRSSVALSLSERVTETEWWLRLADCVRCRFDVVFWRPESQLYIQLKMCAASMCHIYFPKLVKGCHSFRAFQSPLVLDFMEVNVAA